MIKPNWDIFKAKFSENPQDIFEWFCYILFCKEFKQEKGIFRFKNQSAIETNPIKHEKEFIGWQAKFYDTSLSQHKNEILKTLEKAKRDYPKITKLLFYTNEEWGQNKGKTPQGLTEAEEKAKSLGITLEWRCASYFEKVAIDEERIFKHFFTLTKSIFDLIEELKLHTENILTGIQTNIVFDKKSIEIDRKSELEKLKTIDQKVIVLSGTGGVGKTALIKNFYEEVKKEAPFYLFKANEFELRNINGFFKNYDFQDFVNAHKEDENKTIIIDSAEKLLDLKNTNPFKEFLSILIQNNWKIIFTTRDNYIDVLNTDFFEIYNIAPTNIHLQNIDKNQLQDLSEKHSFKLPKDEKLFELIKNPFYLSEYLKYYKMDEDLDYEEFKNRLWKKNITKTNPPRSECFQKIAYLRSNAGNFFVSPDCESSILNELVKDGILGYEDDKGYFITHDIYEEWALEKIISKEFFEKDNNQSFFNEIGQSLPIRRGFRNWISEQLLLKSNDVKSFIEEVIGDDNIDQSWKNEILISILLSDYSDYFFNSFKDLLLKNNQELLKKATFWLRIACKEVDEDFFKQIGLKNVDLSTLKYVLTKPKGNGWKSVINFVFFNLKEIGIENIHFILPVINDWNSKFKKGETTKFSSLIALKYYQWIVEKEFYFFRDDDVKDRLFQTILYGSSEIKDEMKNVFEEILKNKWKNHGDPYYDLSKTILTKLEGISIAQVLPEYTLQLADLFWTYTPPKKDRWNSDSIMGVEQYFQIEDDHLDYFPASSYQTPIYWLLQSAQEETIDFILQFTNKTVEAFAKSEFAKYEVEEVEVFIDNKTTIKQYISNRLWCTYRGTQVSPHVLESMHMALEKFFLERGENTKSETLEYWLMYLLKKSKSASISAVVASIVLAYPAKTFNVAKILFQTKKFFFYDTSRLVLDQTAKSHFSIGYGLNYENKIHQDERIKTCEDKHRKFSLEHLFLNYQFFRSEETSEEEAEKRQKVLWEILDNYYKELADKSKETELDKTWRLYLARMDKRKMNPTTEKTDNGLLIHLNPEIGSELKEYSEKSLEKSSEPMKYSSLKLWANYKMRNDERYKEYKKYESDPKLALKEAKEIVDKLKKTKTPDIFQLQYSEEESLYLFNHSIPAEVCSVLMRDYIDELSKEEKEFCKDIILETASSSFRLNYQYQISDGVESAISVLPILFKEFPEEKETETIKTILLLTLFDPNNIGMYAEFSDFSANAIKELFKISFEDAQSLLFGYLYLKPKYEAMREKIRQENYKRNIYQLHENELIEKFIIDNQIDLQKVLDNKLSYEDLKDIKKLDLYILKKAFQLIPLKTENEDRKKIVKEIISAFVEKLTSDDRDDKIDYIVRHNFLEQLAYFVLSSKQEEIEGYLKPFIDNFNNSEAFADLFEQLILAEDQLDAYDNFWIVWNLFKGKIIGICKDGDSRRYTEKIVKGYLFATVPWKKTTTSWHTLKDENKEFFKEISQKIGNCPSTLYSILKLLTDIGSPYLDDGVLWVSKMLRDNKELSTAKLEVNTIYYLEKNIRKYIYRNRETIRKTKKLKDDVLVILDFLIEKGSVVGYMLRENIL